jgi:hypothetical protein
MKGNITRRGERSWRLKFDLGRDSNTGKRLIHLSTVRGTKKEAQAELTRQLAALDAGTLVEPSKSTVGTYLRAWIDTAEALAVSPKTAERYRQLIEQQVIPHLGAHPLQKLRPSLLRRGTRRCSGPAGRKAARCPPALSDTLTGSCIRRWKTPAAVR